MGTGTRQAGAGSLTLPGAGGAVPPGAQLRRLRSFLAVARQRELTGLPQVPRQRVGEGAVTVSSAAGDTRRGPQPGDGGVDVARLIARGDLVACLDRAAAGKVTVISAPAGSGTTSLPRPLAC